MTYSDNLENEGINSQFLCILKPRRFVDSTSWTLVSGTKYKSSFDFGEITSLDSDGEEQTEATTSSLSDGDWFYDVNDELLYVDLGVDPSTKDVVVTYEIYTGTFDAHFFRLPTDNTSRTVYYEPIIVRSPNISANSTQDIFGFYPVSSTTLSLSNLTHILEKHIYDSSFNNADVDVYHWLGDLSVDNIKLVFKGITRDITYRDNEVTFSILDRSTIFTKDYRYDDGLSFYNTTDFPNLDPDFDKRPIRNVFGVVEGFVPVNVDYNETPTVFNNRDWVCIKGYEDLGSISSNVLSTPSSTTTRTYVDDTDGYRVGDTIWKDEVIDPDEFATITGKGSNYIEHTAFVDAAIDTDVIKRSFIGNVTLIQDGETYNLQYWRDYVEYTDSTNNVAGFSFTDNFETYHVGLTTLSPDAAVFARVYGHKNTATIDSSPFGSDSTNTGNLSQAIIILYQLLKDFGLDESEIDTDSFEDAYSGISDEIGIAIPKNSTSDFPSFKEIIQEILTTILLRFFYNNDAKWSILQVGPLGAETKTVEDDEILFNSVSYKFDYKDIISKIYIEYGFRELSEDNLLSESYDVVNSDSTLATRLHKVERQKTYKSLHFTESEAQTMSDRLLVILEDRIGTFSFSCKNRFFDVVTGDVIKVSRSRLPGFDYDGDENDRKFSITGNSKGLPKVSITMDDQKNIEDNSGSW